MRLRKRDEMERGKNRIEEEKEKREKNSENKERYVALKDLPYPHAPSIKDKERHFFIICILIFLLQRLWSKGQLVKNL